MFHDYSPAVARCAGLCLLQLLSVALPSRSTAAAAPDWPQFLGPHRNLTTSYGPLNLDWPGGEPAIRWSKKLGSGWSGPVVAGGRLIIHHRLQNEEVVSAYDALSGEDLWEQRSATSYSGSMSSDQGPRATPTVAGGSVFTLGVAGVLSCLDAATGKLQWRLDAREVYGADTGFFGMDCSPLVMDGLVLLQIGGRDGHGIVALEAGTGKLRWRATDHEAGYASPVPAAFGGHQQALFFTREGLVAIDPESGRQRFQYPWRSKQHASVNAASPVVVGNNILLTASYNTGAVMLKVADGGVQPLWQGDDKLSAHYATPVYHRGLLFGFHGRVDFPTGAELRCIDADSGRVLWSLDPIRSGTLMLVDDTLLVLTEDGEFFAAPASSKGFKPTVRAQIVGSETRANAAFAGGIYYARGKGRLVALDLRPPTNSPSN